MVSHRSKALVFADSTLAMMAPIIYKSIFTRFFASSFRLGALLVLNKLGKRQKRSDRALSRSLDFERYEFSHAVQGGVGIGRNINLALLLQAI